VAVEIIDGGGTSRDVAKQCPEVFVRYHRGIKALEYEHSADACKKFRVLRTYVLYGEPGVGKTRLVYDCYSADSVFKLNTASNDALWFDGYNAEAVLLLDDFSGWIKYRDFLTLLDGYPYRCPVKGGFTWARWSVVVITSNVSPLHWYQGHSDDWALWRRISISFELPKEKEHAILEISDI